MKRRIKKMMQQGYTPKYFNNNFKERNIEFFECLYTEQFNQLVYIQRTENQPYPNVLLGYEGEFKLKKEEFWYDGAYDLLMLQCENKTHTIPIYVFLDAIEFHPFRDGWFDFGKFFKYYFNLEFSVWNNEEYNKYIQYENIQKGKLPYWIEKKDNLYKILIYNYREGYHGYKHIINLCLKGQFKNIKLIEEGDKYRVHEKIYLEFEAVSEEKETVIFLKDCIDGFETFILGNKLEIWDKVINTEQVYNQIKKLRVELWNSALTGTNMEISLSI